MKTTGLVLMGLAIVSGVCGVYWLATSLAWGAMNAWTIEREDGQWVLVKE